MSVAAFAGSDAWTVDGLYELPEDGSRRELLDGTLLVTPPPSVQHQLAARRLVAAIARALPAGVEVLEAVGVTVPGGLLIPDVVVAGIDAIHRSTRELAAADVLAVVEIASRSSRTGDRGWKPRAYAEAGIGVYVRVELTGPGGQPEVVVHYLDGDRYARAAVATGAEPTTLELPFPVTLAATDLLT